MVFYSCNLRGQCEKDWEGNYRTVEECQAACTPPTDREEEDLARIIASYDEYRALSLAPSDRVVLMKMLTGMTVQPDDSYRLLFAYYNNDYLALYRHEGGLEYLSTTLEPQLMRLSFLILDIHEELSQMVESAVFDGVEATDWQRLIKKAHYALTRLFKGVDSRLDDETPERGGTPMDENEFFLTAANYLITDAMQYYYGTHGSGDDRLIEFIREEKMLDVLKELYGPIPVYMR